jgi:membrane protease YdiL (CAAX protease family)
MSRENPFDPSKFRPYRPDGAHELPAATPGDRETEPDSVLPAPAEVAVAAESRPESKWPDDIPVGGNEAILAILVVWALAVIVSYHESLLGRIVDLERLPSWTPYVLTLVEHALVIGLMFYLLCVKHDVGLVDGLHLRPGPKRWTIAAAISGAVLCGIVLAVLHATGTAPRGISRSGPDEPVLLVLITLAAVSGAFAWELFYRGLVFPLLRRGIGLVLAVLVVTVWFSFGQASQVGGNYWLLIPVGVLGLAATLARHFSRSLGPAVAMNLTYYLTLCVYLWVRTLV